MTANRRCVHCNAGTPVRRDLTSGSVASVRGGPEPTPTRRAHGRDELSTDTIGRTRRLVDIASGLYAAGMRPATDSGDGDRRPFRRFLVLRNALMSVLSLIGVVHGTSGSRWLAELTQQATKRGLWPDSADLQARLRKVASACAWVSLNRTQLMARVPAVEVPSRSPRQVRGPNPALRRLESVVVVVREQVSLPPIVGDARAYREPEPISY